MDKKVTGFSPEVRERAVRLVREQRSEHPPMWGAVESIAPIIGCTPQTPHEWVKRDQINHDERDDVTTGERERLKALEREVRELRRAKRDSQGRERVFRPSEVRPPFQALKAFIDQHRDTFGVEPICKVLRIVPSGYRRHAAQLVIRHGSPFAQSAMNVCGWRTSVCGGPTCLEADEPEAYGSGALHGRTVDEATGSARRDARQACSHDCS
ncbi:transposase-like protein [Paraburkholderia caledonica]|uniref:Transposase-like protein n=1 Tax=Paraburkholderia caledonica TaxID=134536 RepID=A0AB73IQ00_9BURK|nr:transposase-like protein [Paraburkholderia caledonica]